MTPTPLLLAASRGPTPTEWAVAAGVLVTGVVLSRVLKTVTARKVGGDRGEGTSVAQLVARAVGYLVVLAAPPSRVLRTARPWWVGSMVCPSRAAASTCTCHVRCTDAPVALG